MSDKLPLLTSELNRLTRELAIYKSVTSAMLGTLDLEQILYVILSGITSAEGLGFNRAFLFLDDEAGRALRVVMALGPSSEAEARQIWEEMRDENLTLDELLPRYEAYRQDERAHRLTRWLGHAVLPLDRLWSLAASREDMEEQDEVELIPALARCLVERASFASNSLTLRHLPPHLGAQGLSFRYLALVPLAVGGRLLGAILADNIYSSTPVDKDCLVLLDGLGDLAALAIDRARLHAKTVAMAEVDGLTGAYNRRFYDEELQRAMEACRRSGQPLSAVVFDLDHFKRTNDAYGHLVGDEVLKHVARTIKENVRQSDKLARYGGEEFVLLLRDTGQARAGQVARKLCRLIKETPVKGTPVKRITLSAGVSTSRGEDHPTSLFDRADRALYDAKNSGRDRVVSWTEKLGEGPIKR
jgi:diguanylate cyclase (GGDEF)-like protein